MDVIKSTIKCDECSRVLQKPVMLPCGAIVCCKHLDNLPNGVFFCKSCEDDHHIEEKDKIVNRRFERLIEANLDKFNFGPEYNAALEECNKLDQTINDLEAITKDPTHFVKETIWKLKNQTELIREEFKLKIDQKANQIIQKLDEYEKACTNNLNSYEFRIKSVTIRDFIRKVKEDQANWQKILNDFSSSKSDWKRIKQTSHEFNLKLKQESSDLITRLLIEKLNDHSKLVSNFQDNKLAIETLFDKQIQKLDSKIIDDSMKLTFLKLCDFESEIKFNLIYRASEHGFTAGNFHAKCDYIPNTLTIIKSTSGYIFGGYTSQTWDQSNTYNIYKKDPKAFLFSLVNAQNRPEKLKVKSSSNAICCKSDMGPSFGIFDLRTFSTTSNGYSELGFSYPKRFNDQNFIPEYITFSIENIEVYRLV